MENPPEQQTKDWILKLVLKHERNIKLQSMKKGATKYLQEIKLEEIESNEDNGSQMKLAKKKKSTKKQTQDWTN